MVEQPTKPILSILEDDEDLRYSYQLEFRDNFTLHLYANISDFKKNVETVNQSHAVILDISLNNTNIFKENILPTITAPYFIVSGAYEIEQIKASFDSGAVDFLQKPVHFKLLKYKLDILRNTYHNYPIKLDHEKNICLYNSKQLELTLKEMHMLNSILKNPPKSLHRETLYKEIWNNEKRSPKTIYTHLNNLRSKLKTIGIILEYEGGIIELKFD